MANSDQLEELKEQLTIELTNTLNAQMGAKNQEIDDENTENEQDYFPKIESLKKF